MIKHGQNFKRRRYTAAPPTFDDSTQSFYQCGVKPPAALD